MSIYKNLLTSASRECFLKNLKNIRVPLPPDGNPKDNAAVLVALCPVNDVVSLLYTMRSAGLRTNAGQISFPGGKCDKNELPIITALRETEEEIGINRDRIHIWGQAPAVPGRGNKTLITPVIGCIEDLKANELNVNPQEVSDVFAISLECFCDPKNHYHTQFRNGFILPVFSIDSYKIWGLTAFITHTVLSCLLPRDVYKNEWHKKKIVL